MKLIIRPKVASVYSEVEVTTTGGALLYSSETEPLSVPRVSYFKNASFEKLATVTTSRTDRKQRAHHVVMADGRVLDLVRKFRNPISTTESCIAVKNLGWQIVIRRAWTSRFEILEADGTVLAEAKESLTGFLKTYELNVKDEAHLDELALFSIIARYVMLEDTPHAAPAPPV